MSGIDYSPLAPPLSPLQVCSTLCTGEYHEKKCPIAKVLRNEWATPRWLTERLPRFSLDPCTNERSTVPAEVAYYPEHDGLRGSWQFQTVFCNPPYDDILPWARKAGEARAFVFLVNADSSTKWWRELVKQGGHYRFDFDKRLQFDPPPRIKPSTNNKPSCLLCNWEGAKMVYEGLVDMGRWWVTTEIATERAIRDWTPYPQQ